MMIKLYSLLVIAALTQFVTSDQSKLIVVKQPSNQVYDYSITMNLSDLQNIILAANGLSIDQSPKYTGLKSTNSLLVPKATILFLVNSNSLSDSFSNQFVPINEDITFNLPALESSLTPSVTTRYYTNALADLTNLGNDCSGQLSSVFYTFQVPDSEVPQLNEIVNSTITQFIDICVADPTNDLLVYVLAINQKNVVKRQAPSGGPGPVSLSGNIVNPASFYSDQYPAMFNLLFWITLILALAVFAIAYGMFNMDPGLDTVIYRMTSQRIKKDN